MSEFNVNLTQQWQLGPDRAWPVNVVERAGQDPARLERYVVSSVRKPTYAFVSEMDSPLTQVMDRFDPSAWGENTADLPYVASPLSPRYETERQKAIDYQAHLESLQTGMGQTLSPVISRLTTMHCKYNTNLVIAADMELRASSVSYWLAYRQATDPDAASLFLSEIVGIVPSSTSPVGPEPLVRGRDGIPGCLPPFMHGEVYVDMASIPEPVAR